LKTFESKSAAKKKVKSQIEIAGRYRERFKRMKAKRRRQKASSIEEWAFVVKAAKLLGGP
jgi:hypothetical protein